MTVHGTRGHRMESLTNRLESVSDWIKQAVRAYKRKDFEVAATAYRKAAHEVRDLDFDQSQKYYGKAASVYLKGGEYEAKKGFFAEAAANFEKAGSIFKNKMRNADAAWDCYIRATECRLHLAESGYPKG